MTEKLDDFLDWLEEQNYWVNNSVVEEKWPNIKFAESTGITVKENDDGDIMIPKRDLKSLAIRSEERR